jgi:predicted transcriptional regulator
VDDSNNMVIAAEIVAAYVASNSVAAADLPALIGEVHMALQRLAAPAEPAQVEVKPTPAIAIKKSVTLDFITCLEDGRKFKSLKRHLSTAYGMTPDDYRSKWGLPDDYPMTAPNYAAQRSALAKAAGLGQGGRKKAIHKRRSV